MDECGVCRYKNLDAPCRDCKYSNNGILIVEMSKQLKKLQLEINKLKQKLNKVKKIRVVEHVLNRKSTQYIKDGE